MSSVKKFLDQIPIRYKFAKCTVPPGSSLESIGIGLTVDGGSQYRWPPKSLITGEHDPNHQTKITNTVDRSENTQSRLLLFRPWITAITEISWSGWSSSIVGSGRLATEVMTSICVAWCWWGSKHMCFRASPVIYMSATIIQHCTVIVSHCLTTHRLRAVACYRLYRRYLFFTEQYRRRPASV